MGIEQDAALLLVLHEFGIDPSTLLGNGGEACVFALDAERILRVYHPPTTRESIRLRIELLAELALSASALPFAIPVVLETSAASGRLVTIERRWPGRPLLQLLHDSSGPERDAMIVALLDCAGSLSALRLDRAWFGDLCEGEPVRAPSWHRYLEQRAARSLAAAGADFAAIDPSALVRALPELDTPSFVHLDLFGGNVLIDAGKVSAVVDFGGVPIAGDARLDPLSCAAYLTPYITPAATERDRSIARAWLKAHGLDELFEPTRRWLAARWSFARDDVKLHQWCRSVLLDDPLGTG